MKVVSVFVLALMVAGHTGRAADPRPNIVFIMADDVGIEGIGCYGGSSYRTPRIDQLAAGGLRFTHAYSQPLCTPTRVQLMTGKYNHRNWSYFGILDPRERTFGHLLKSAGYRTCIAGKWQLQSYDPPDFPNAAHRRGKGMKVAEAGFEEYSLYHAWHTEDKGSRYANPTFDKNGKLVRALDGRYGPDTSVDFMLDFMKRHRDEAMFVYYPMALPHWPMTPTPDSEEWKDVSRRLEESTDYFGDMVEYMDKLVGRIVDGIDALGLRENTIVIFYSDNGTHLKITSRMNGEDVRGGKALPIQTGIRVPLIANWPARIKAGRITSDLVDASDFLPTLAGLAGAEIPADWQMDGVSFVPSLFDTAGPRREWCFFWYDPRPGWDKDRFSRHIFALDHNYKLFSDGRFFDIAGSGVREVALDLERLGRKETEARAKLREVIRKTLLPPLSPGALKEVDACGDPIR